MCNQLCMVSGLSAQVTVYGLGVHSSSILTFLGFSYIAAYRFPCNSQVGRIKCKERWAANETEFKFSKCFLRAIAHIRHLHLSIHYPMLYQHTKPPHIILSCFHIPAIYPTKELGMQGSDMHTTVAKYNLRVTNSKTCRNFTLNSIHIRGFIHLNSTYPQQRSITINQNTHGGWQPRTFVSIVLFCSMGPDMNQQIVGLWCSLERQLISFLKRDCHKSFSFNACLNLNYLILNYDNPCWILTFPSLSFSEFTSCNDKSRA